MSTDGKVKWSSINKYFPFKWIPNGYAVNNNSYAEDIFKEMKEGKTISDYGCNEVLADAWFWEDRNYKKDYFMFEQNIQILIITPCLLYCERSDHRSGKPFNYYKY
jgi:hypothetical protein